MDDSLLPTKVCFHSFLKQLYQVKYALNYSEVSSYFLCLSILLACVSVHHVPAVPEEAKRDVGSPETGVTES